MTVVFIMACAGLCGCDDRLEEQAAVWAQQLAAPFKQAASGEISWRELPDLLTGRTKAGGEAEKVPEVPAAAEKTAVRLFFVNAGGTGLVEETRQIDRVPGIARATLEALLAGPAGEDAAALFPEGTRLNGVNITPEGVLKVDFSPEIRRMAAEKEEMARLAVIKTLAQFPGVKNVQFMVDGFSVNSLTGGPGFDVQ